MQFGSFNYYKIKFFLDVLQTEAERLAYLNKLRKDVERIINCFTSPKAVPLRMYAEEKIQLPDGCPELSLFIQNAVHSQSPFPNDKRLPSNEILKELVKKETLQYQKLLNLVDAEITHINKTGEPIGRETNEIIEEQIEKEKPMIVNKQVYLELNPDKITNLLIEIDRKTEEHQAKKEELSLSSEKLRAVFELLIQEGFIAKEKLNSAEKFIKTFASDDNINDANATACRQC